MDLMQATGKFDKHQLKCPPKRLSRTGLSEDRPDLEGTFAEWNSLRRKSCAIYVANV